MKDIEAFEEALKEKNIKAIVKYFFPFEGKELDLTPIQLDMVRTIAFAEKKRICINAMTRYGKSLCVSLAICIYILLHPNRKIALIAPQKEQAEILRNYLAEFIVSSPVMNEVVDFDNRGVGIASMKKQASRIRQTFKNGCEYRVFSAEGEANRLMGFGVNGIVVKDEACLIDYRAEAKISRMLGDAPDDTILVELANPWKMGCRYYEDWVSGRFHKFHISWETALEEGRTTSKFIEEQRDSLTPLEFTVLYESDFPEEADDAVFNLRKIKNAQELDFEFKEFRTIISCDVADKGLDKTVIYKGKAFNDHYKVEDIYTEDKSENMKVAGKLNSIIQEAVDRNESVMVNIDCIGIGTGVVSRVKEFVDEQEFEDVIVNACHFGEGVGSKGSEMLPTKGNRVSERIHTDPSKRFLNKKAQQYFRLRSLFEDEKICIPDDGRIVSELVRISWEWNSSAKIKIIDPEEKSPDFSDALVYFVWKTEDDVFLDFGEFELQDMSKEVSVEKKNDVVVM